MLSARARVSLPAADSPGTVPPTLAQVVWAYREFDLGGFSVDGVTLFQSILGPQGATYRNLGGFAL